MDPVERSEIASTGVFVSRLGWGGSSIGDLYRKSSDEEAVQVISTAMDAGINYFDTAPWYGRGLSEERLGNALTDYDQSRYVVSTKVPELVMYDGKGSSGGLFPSKERTVERLWTAEGTRQSVTESLERLGMDRVDILYIHDCYREAADPAIRETYPVLAEMRSSGLVGAVGLGIGDCDIICRFIRECDLDCILLWGNYSLLNFQAMDELLPLCAERGVDIVLGAPYESGILASNLKPEEAKYRYRNAPADVLERAVKINDVCVRHDVPLKAAALQFVFGQPMVKSVIPGTRSSERFLENFAMLSYDIPSVLWDDLKEENLIPKNAPAPV